MKAKINLPNIKGFIQGNFRKLVNDFGDLLEPHIKKEAEWRLNQVKEKSPECFNQDKCVHCGCQVSAKVFEDRGCEQGCYPEMMDKEEWEKFIFNWNLEQVYKEMDELMLFGKNCKLKD